MSIQPNNHAGGPRQRATGRLMFRWLRVIVCMIPLVGASLLPPSLYAQATKNAAAPSLPLLVSARQGDTPASIARRYLDDASKGWMIKEYNDRGSFSGGEAILVPVAPFRPGGLNPDGYQTIPVLAYVDVGETSGHRQQVSRSAFSQQMRWLKTEGFSAITPTQLVNFMEFIGQLPRRSVLITFDTTSQRLYDVGIPILKAHGFTATVFLATNDVGSKGAMNWEQIRQLQAAGFTIACRGQNGRRLTRRTSGQSFNAYFKSVESELRLAREAIETQLGTPCQFLAYPGGRTNRLVSAMVAKIGFSAAFSRQPGDNPFFTDRFGIHRTVIDSQTSPAQFGQKLTTLIKADLN
jgi:peptidoglycan/xylan/chitin deacetylase (PgdA/CDA1 family)